MSKFDKLILKLLSGTSDTNFDFTNLVSLLERFGFSVRIKGSHHIFFKDGIDEIINLQPLNNKAKAYQVKLVREILIKYKLVNSNADKYEIIIYWSKEDNLFIAEVPELPGCKADGNSYAEALQNAEPVINEWIETAKSLGRIIPEPKGKLMYA